MVFKTSPKLVGITILLMWLLFLISTPIRDFYQVNLEIENPTFVATIEKMATGRILGKPRIKYNRILQSSFDGTWHAYLEDKNNNLICGGDGLGTYPQDSSGVVYMGWAYFLGEDCGVPEQEYRICAAYSLSHKDRIERKPYGPFCSVYYPVGGVAE